MTQEQSSDNNSNNSTHKRVRKNLLHSSSCDASANPYSTSSTMAYAANNPLKSSFNSSGLNTYHLGRYLKYPFAKGMSNFFRSQCSKAETAMDIADLSIEFTRKICFGGKCIQFLITLTHCLIKEKTYQTK